MPTRLTELEGAVLALVGRSAPVTGYALTRMTAASPSEYWSGSAGAVYPLVKRLAERGLIAAMAGSQGKRNRTSYSLTAEGEQALKSWVLDSQRAAGLGFDPLRTRVVYLDQCSAAEREAFFGEVQHLLDQAVAENAAQPNERLQALYQAVLASRLQALKAFEQLPG